jgi:hypothetical protein
LGFHFQNRPVSGQAFSSKFLQAAAVQKRSFCSAVHPSNLLSDKQVLNAWLAMLLREFFVPLSQQNS